MLGPSCKTAVYIHIIFIEVFLLFLDWVLTLTLFDGAHQAAEATDSGKLDEGATHGGGPACCMHCQGNGVGKYNY